MKWKDKINDIKAKIDPEWSDTQKEGFLVSKCAEQKIPLSVVRKSDELRKYSITHLFNIIDLYIADAAIKRFFGLNCLAFADCPASTKYHGNYYGGLLDHTVTVCYKAIEVANCFNYNHKVQIESVIKCCLLHDIGKLGTIETPMYLLNPDFIYHKKEPFIYNSELVQLPHEMYSIFLIGEYSIPLEPCEMQAIVYHNGLYVDGAKEALKGREHPLTLIVHTADNLSSKILEA